MTRTDLQRLADIRLEDAEALLLSQRWAGAYYLLGYTVECALKACVARQFRQDEVPEKTIVIDFYTHRLDKLLVISGLKPTLDTRMASDVLFQRSWTTLRDWSESSRYDHSITEVAARELQLAVSDPNCGVLPWLRALW